LILNRLRQDGDVEEGISPNFLVRNWPPAFKEWSTKSARNAFFASPQFPRLLNAEVVKDTIARGVSSSILAYVGKSGDGEYEPFYYGSGLSAKDVEFSDDMFIITKETAESYLSAHGAQAGKTAKEASPFASPRIESPGDEVETEYTAGEISQRDLLTSKQPTSNKLETPSSTAATKLRWVGEVSPQKWMNFYTKVLSRFAASKGLKLTLNVEVFSEGGISTQKIEETKVALRELGLDDDIQVD